MKDFFKKGSWVSWAICAVLLLATAWLWWDRSVHESPFTPERMKEEVSIKYTDTGDVVTMPRGRFEKLLRDPGTKLDPGKGLINPKTGQPTGFLYSQREWEEAVKRVNEAVDRSRASLPENVRQRLDKEAAAALPTGPGGTAPAVKPAEAEKPK